VLPGTPTTAALAASGWLFPAGAPSALPSAARTGDLAVPPGMVVVRSGASATVRVTATHPPGGEPWATLATFPQGQDAVRVSLQWSTATASLSPATGCPTFSAASPAPVACESADLPRVVLPGSAVPVKAVLHAVGADGRPLPPGLYTVRLGLYQQLVGSFAGSGTTTLTVRVTA
jgi:hypothetical protein